MEVDTFADHMFHHYLVTTALPEHFPESVAKLLIRVLSVSGDNRVASNPVYQIAKRALSAGASKERIVIIANELGRVGCDEGIKLKQLTEET